MKLENEPDNIVKYDSISYLQKHTRSRSYGILRERVDLAGKLILFLFLKVFCRVCFQYIYLVST